MTESLFIFGNGLGRSIDPDYFDLKTGLKRAWDNAKLTDAEKQLILQSIGKSPENLEVYPETESELYDLQTIVEACAHISNFQQSTGEDWLTEHGKSFPAAINKFVHFTALTYLQREHSGNFSSDRHKPTKQFSDTLKEFITENGAHILTVNYDDLLYDLFTEDPLMKKRKLRDGFLADGFNWDKCVRWHDTSNNTKGWFMHLHGSPLFRSEKGKIKKFRRSEIPSSSGEINPHIILTHQSFKKSLIQKSQILNSYWDMFIKMLPQNKNIILFGMSGDDEHINEAIRAYAHQNATIRVVDWCEDNDTEQQNKEKHWKSKLGDKFDTKNLVLLSNVQDFTDWALPAET